MINFLKKALRFIVGVVALPLVITASRAFFNEISNISFSGEPGQSYFLWGVVAYTILHLFFYKPRHAQNPGRENKQAAPAWLSFLPYFVPIYTILAALIYFGLSKITEVTNYTPYFMFAMGFTMAMHIILTVEALKVAQPDLLRTGYFFSLAIIYVLNIAVTAFIISLAFTGFSFTEMALQFCVETKVLYVAIFSQLFAVR